MTPRYSVHSIALLGAFLGLSGTAAAQPSPVESPTEEAPSAEDAREPEAEDSASSPGPFETESSESPASTDSETPASEPVVLEETPSAGGAALSEVRPSPGSQQGTVHATGGSSHQSEAAPEEPPASIGTIGIDPSMPEYDAGMERTDMKVGKDWQFDFHGYLRAPFRMGLGPKNDGSEGLEEHGPPRVPDSSFTDWRYTHNLPGPWTQLLFSVGKGNVKATVGIASFNHTNASYRNLQANLGINEAFLTVQYPKAFGRFGGISVNVGSFSNRYGAAGKYNAGRYNTYLFGRTRVAGETLTAGLNLSRNVLLTLEHGIGSKIDIVPSETVNPRPAYLPYGGPEPQGTTWVHHGHANLRLFKKITFGAHYLRSRSPDDRQLPGAPSEPGHMRIMGGDIRADLGAFGYGYLGYSNIDAHEILVLSDAIEVLHSFHGWNFKNNYFGRFNQRTGEAAPDTSGQVDTVLFQYDLSIGALARHPTRFLGRGPDVKVSLFAMFNKITSENNSHEKFKWGADLIYLPVPVFGVGARYDLVQPDLRDDTQSFAIVSPRIVFKSEWVTREEVSIQYSRYFLGERAYPAFPYADIDEADPHAFMVAGRMWW